MTRRLVLSYLAVTVLVLAVLEVPLGVYYARRERERVTADLAHDATVMATIYEDSLERGVAPDPAPALDYRVRTGARVVVVDPGGTALIDTDGTVGRDFSSRPELIEALAGRRATGWRASATLGTDLLYVATPVASGGVVHGAVRLTVETGEVERRIDRFWMGLAGMAAIVLVLAAAVGWAIARSLGRPIRRLDDAAARIAGGDFAIDRAPPPTGPPELRHLDRSMRTMAGRLDELFAAQRSFVADASHQLRTPLTALRLRLENLQSASPSADLDAALDETERLSALVDDLLQLARVDDRRPIAQDLGELAAARVDTWRAVADQAGVALQATGLGTSAPVQALPGAIEQVLDNLLDNALRVAPRGSSVGVEVARAGDWWRLTITDAGPGLSDEDKVRARQRFWRGGRGDGGSGLGLPIAEALVGASGGALSLTDSPSGGLAVSVTFPAAVTGRA